MNQYLLNALSHNEIQLAVWLIVFLSGIFRVLEEIIIFKRCCLIEMYIPYMIYQICDVAVLISLPMSCLFLISIIISSDRNLNRIIRWRRYSLHLPFTSLSPEFLFSTLEQVKIAEWLTAKFKWCLSLNHTKICVEHDKWVLTKHDRSTWGKFSQIAKSNFNLERRWIHAQSGACFWKNTGEGVDGSVWKSRLTCNSDTVTTNLASNYLISLPCGLHHPTCKILI